MATFQIEANGRSFQIDSDATEEQMRAYLATESGQDMLAQQIAAIPAAEPQQPAWTPPEKFTREGVAQTLEALTFEPETAKQISESPVTDLMAGMARGVEKVSLGIQQLASNDAEALALAEIEKESRRQFEEIDKGIGLEDAGELSMLVGSMILPGGAATQTAAQGARAIQFLKALPSSIGGTAILAAMGEGISAKTPEESRVTEALKTGVITAIVGKGAEKVMNRVGSSMMGTLSTLGMMATPMTRRVTAEGMARRISRYFQGKSAKSPLTDTHEKVIAQKVSPVKQTAVLKEAEAAAQQVKRSAGITPDTAEEFFNFLEQTEKNIRPVKAAKEAGITTKEALRAEMAPIFSVLNAASMKTSVLPDGTIKPHVDATELHKAYQKIKNEPAFQKYLSAKKRKEVGEWVTRMRNEALETGANPTAVAAFRSAQGKIDDMVDENIAEIGAARTEALAPTPPRFPRVGRGAAAYEALLREEGLANEDVESFLLEQGYAGFMDLFKTIEERAGGQ